VAFLCNMLDFEYFLPRETLFAELNGWAGHANGLL
jgi:hypothetical protein